MGRRSDRALEAEFTNCVKCCLSRIGIDPHQRAEFLKQARSILDAMEAELSVKERHYTGKCRKPPHLATGRKVCDTATSVKLPSLSFLPLIGRVDIGSGCRMAA